MAATKQDVDNLGREASDGSRFDHRSVEENWPSSRGSSSTSMLSLVPGFNVSQEQSVKTELLLAIYPQLTQTGTPEIMALA